MPFNHDKPQRRRENGGPPTRHERSSWRDSMERSRPVSHDLQPIAPSPYIDDSPMRDGHSPNRYAGSNSRQGKGRSKPRNGYNNDVPTLPRRTLRGEPPPGARYAGGSHRGKSSSRTWMAGIYISLTCSVLCLGVLTASLATDSWIHTYVNRDALLGLATGNLRLQRLLNTSLLYRNNHRGLFRTCYAAVPAANDVWSAADAECHSETGYELQRATETQNWGDDYEVRIHLIRLAFISLLLGLIFLMTTIMLSLVGCLCAKRGAITVGVGTAFLAFLFVCSCLGSFHGVDYYEVKRLHHEPFPADWDTSHAQLSRNYNRQFGYSYFLVWVGTALALISLVCLVISYVSLSSKGQRGRRPLSQDPPYANMNPSYGTTGSRMSDEADTYYTTSSTASRNLAYDMTEHDVAPPDELDCIDEGLFGVESTRM